MSTQRSTTLRDKHRRIIAADEPPCHWCQGHIDYVAHHLDPKAFQIDHVVPLDAGGPDTLDNLVASHRACNRAKSNKPAATTTSGVDFVTARTW